MGTEGSLLCSQEPASGSYPESLEFKPSFATLNRKVAHGAATYRKYTYKITASMCHTAFFLYSHDLHIKMWIIGQGQL